MKLNENGLTDKQQAILNFIKEYIILNKIPPTIREICSSTGIKSTSTVHLNLTTLSEKGLIYYQKGSRRSISLSNTQPSATDAIANNSVSVPIIGNVAAGTPILAVDNIQDYIALPVELLNGVSKDTVFILVINGESMINAGILNGDYIIVNASASVNNGDIAVVRVGKDYATVKRFYRESDRVKLQPENYTMQPIYAPLCEVEIVGRVIGLIRHF